jgi:hypothetical protein
MSTEVSAQWSVTGVRAALLLTALDKHRGLRYFYLKRNPLHGEFTCAPAELHL